MGSFFRSSFVDYQDNPRRRRESRLEALFSGSLVIFPKKDGVKRPRTAGNPAAASLLPIRPRRAESGRRRRGAMAGPLSNRAQKMGKAFYRAHALPLICRFWICRFRMKFRKAPHQETEVYCVSPQRGHSPPG